MKRKEGIIKRFEIDQKTKPTAQMAGDLWRREYASYVDQCYYCYEEPLAYEYWLNETIKPVKE